MPFLLCNILIAFPLFFDISSLVFCPSPWVLCVRNSLYTHIYAGCVCWISSFVFTDGDFCIKRRLVFHKTTGRFLAKWIRRKVDEERGKAKCEMWNVKIPITALSRAHTRTRILQEFLYFCCHKCHTVIGKHLLSRMLWYSFDGF